MSRIDWNLQENVKYRKGVDRVVLFVGSNDGVAWSGVTAITEKEQGGEAQPFYIDGVKYANVASRVEFEATIEAFYSPQEFDVCDGEETVVPGVTMGQRYRESFGLTFRNMTKTKYDLHVVYNATAKPSTRTHGTRQESTEPSTLAWDLTTMPVDWPGFFPTAHVIIDGETTPSWVLEAIEDVLYGTENSAPWLPYPVDLIDLFSLAGRIIVIDHGNGSYSVIGPDELVYMSSTWEFTVDHDISAVEIDENTFELSSTP